MCNQRILLDAYEFFTRLETMGGGGGLMTTFGDFWGLMGTKNHGDSG